MPLPASATHSQNSARAVASASGPSAADATAADGMVSGIGPEAIEAASREADRLCENLAELPKVSYSNRDLFDLPSAWAAAEKAVEAFAVLAPKERAEKEAMLEERAWQAAGHCIRHCCLNSLAFLGGKIDLGKSQGKTQSTLLHSAIRAITGEQVKNANQYFGPASYPFDPTKAIERGRSEEFVDFLLPLSNPNAQNSEGETPLMVAAKVANIHAVEKLIAVSDLSLRDKKGRTPLMRAACGVYAQERSIAIIDTLAALSPLGETDASSMSALAHAARDGEGKVFAHLIRVNGFTPDGPTPQELIDVATEHAAFNWRIEAVHALAPWLGRPEMAGAARKMAWVAAARSGGEKAIDLLMPLIGGNPASESEPQQPAYPDCLVRTVADETLSVASHHHQRANIDAAALWASPSIAQRVFYRIAKSDDERAKALPRFAAHLQAMEIRKAAGLGASGAAASPGGEATSEVGAGKSPGPQGQSATVATPAGRRI